MEEELPDLVSRFDAAIDASNFHEACLHLAKIRRLTGDNPDVLAAHGHILLNLGRVTEAREAAWKAAGLDPEHQETLKLLGRLAVRVGHAGTSLSILPGASSAKVALPLDYPPSRQLEPRWTPARPHEQLASLFQKRSEEYKHRVSELRTLQPFLSRIPERFQPDMAPNPGWVGGPANALDLAFLYYFVWRHRPATYLEIGSGLTTSFARRAIDDHALPTRIVSIDPEPRSTVDAICHAVVRGGLETLPDLELFKNLQPGDIVFMDGSHRTFMNSDVTVFFLDVLPLLKPGVVVHIHDIALPLDYQAWAIPWYWNEQYMLAAHLLGMGDRVEVLMPVQYLCCTPGLNECLQPPIVPGFAQPGVWLDGGSFWFTHRG